MFSHVMVGSNDIERNLCDPICTARLKATAKVF